jgi:cytochrome P450
MTIAMDRFPFLDIDAPGFSDDPLPAIEEARRTSWVATSERGHEILNYVGCEAGFHNRDLHHGAQRRLQQMGLEARDVSGGGRNLSLSEGPAHTDLRRAVARWFTPRQVGQLRERVRGHVEALVEPFTAAGGGDLMADVVCHLPGTVFCWMVGAPDEEGDRLYRLAGNLQPAFSGNPEQVEAVVAALAEMGAFIEELIDAKRRQPGDDLTSILLAAADAGELESADVFSLSMELLGASTENTANSAGLAVDVLAAHPAEWRRLVADRSLVPTAVEECLRYAPRVPCAHEWTPHGTQLLDLVLPADADVFYWLIGGCFDPAVYPDPHHFDVGRAHAKPQLNFGAGGHFCPGAALARMELQVLLEVLVERWATVESAGDSQMRRGDTSVSVERLPLAVAPR